MGCNLFILAQKEFEYFFSPVGGQNSCFASGVVTGCTHSAFFYYSSFLHCCLYLSYLLSIPSLDAAVNTSSLEYAQDLDLTSLLILKPSLTPSLGKST